MGLLLLHPEGVSLSCPGRGNTIVVHCVSGESCCKMLSSPGGGTNSKAFKYSFCTTSKIVAKNLIQQVAQSNYGFLNLTRMPPAPASGTCADTSFTRAMPEGSAGVPPVVFKRRRDAFSYNKLAFGSFWAA